MPRSFRRQTSAGSIEPAREPEAESSPGIAAKMSSFNIVIVGGGAAGAFLALALGDRLAGRCRIRMFDRHGRFGRGVAYSAPAPWHRLNIPAAKMGGRNDGDPNGFVDWLIRRGHLRPGDYAGSFVPRALYGDYLCELLAEVATAGTLAMRHGAVIAVEPRAHGYTVRTDTAEEMDGDVVALCLGNPPPPPFAAVPASERWVGDPWRPGALARIAPQDDVLLIGSGATAVDVALDLVHRGVGRRIVMLSRKGLLPRSDAAPVAYSGLEHLDLVAPSMRGLTRLLRSEIERAAAKGIPWQSVLDAFRVHLVPVWARSDEAEQRRFLRHLRSVWLVHRHRLAPDVADLLSRLQSDAVLSVIAGRLVEAHPVAAGYRAVIAERAGGARAVTADWIVNCAGPEENYRRLADPLVQHLFAAGRARPGPLQLGLDVDDCGLLLTREGRPQHGLYVLGPPTRGRFWEITAAPWIRTRAASMAEHVAAMKHASEGRRVGSSPASADL
ncbi:MAG TPA: FAD/NAD(P)-binding protein [Xanthobacteraceae bacterium]|jgi:uncharacterized NAD(P)/FAD-binding protein YdhS